MTRRSPDPSWPHVVIVGAGFGGLSAAQSLARAPVRITLIDRRNHHLFQPLLYQVATAALSPAEIAWPIRHVLRDQANAEVRLAEVTAVDLQRRRLTAGEAELNYDFLILAVGNRTAYFGRDDWAANAPGLKTMEEALALRARVLSAFERAEATDDEAERTRLLTFIVVGGGPTGVEMAGAIAELARDALPREFRRIDTRRARVILVEAGPRILAQLPERCSDYAKRVLMRMGVEVFVGSPVMEVEPHGVRVSGARIASATIIWAAGVATDDLVRALPAEHDRQGRAMVGPDLGLPNHPEVFVIGDAAAAQDRKGKPVPGLAPAAKQAGKHAARVIAAKVAGRKPPGPFHYRHAGNLATIGRSAAVVQFDAFRLTGFAGWVFWSIAHVFFMIGVRSRVAVALDWFWSYLTRSRAARLIVGG